MAARQPNGFGIHPSIELIQAYTNNHWQGQDPQIAKIIFLGLDANWDKNIHEWDGMFPEILEYLSDGVAYWDKYNRHHPFLSDRYRNPKSKKRGEGFKYHNLFQKVLNISKEYRNHISFIEMINVPTFGTAKTTDEIRLWNDMYNNDKHRTEIKKLLFPSENKSQIVFVSSGVYEDLSKTFPINWPVFPARKDYDFKILHKHNNAFIISAKHFSDAIRKTHYPIFELIVKSFITPLKQNIKWEVNIPNIGSDSFEANGLVVLCDHIMEKYKSQITSLSGLIIRPWLHWIFTMPGYQPVENSCNEAEAYKIVEHFKSKCSQTQMKKLLIKTML